MKQVIHIFGASGSGTSTLGRYISKKLGCFFMDTEDSLNELHFSLKCYVVKWHFRGEGYRHLVSSVLAPVKPFLARLIETLMRNIRA